jgi:hypothetical protein
MWEKLRTITVVKRFHIYRTSTAHYIAMVSAERGEKEEDHPF